jgi:predicted regulator of Ras-like GTPase activity (Roadblock/LC7/MglB family)
MLARLLSNLDQIDATVRAPDGTAMAGVGGLGAVHATLLHDTARMATALDLGSIEEIWLESSETKLVAALMRGDASLWLTARTVPIGRLSHEARTLRPVIEDLIEV